MPQAQKKNNKRSWNFVHNNMTDSTNKERHEVKLQKGTQKIKDHKIVANKLNTFFSTIGSQVTKKAKFKSAQFFHQHHELG